MFRWDRELFSTTHLVPLNLPPLISLYSTSPFAAALLSPLMVSLGVKYTLFDSDTNTCLVDFDNGTIESSASVNWLMEVQAPNLGPSVPLM